MTIKKNTLANETQHTDTQHSGNQYNWLNREIGQSIILLQCRCLYTEHR
jgi:hypothetical protein